MRRVVWFNLVLLAGLLIGSCSQKSKSVLPEKQSNHMNLVSTEGRVNIKKGKEVEITHREIYVMKMEQDVYPLRSDKEIKATIRNQSGPNANAGTPFVLEYWEGGKWVTVPFIDNFAFTYLAYYFSPGEAFDYLIKESYFKNKFGLGKYRIQTKVSVELFAEFDITDDVPSVKQRKDRNVSNPFGLNVSSALYQKNKESIVFTVNNHSDMPVSLSLYPQLKMQKEGEWLYINYPALQNSSGAAAKMLCAETQIGGGSSFELHVPIQCRDKEGQLEAGYYQCRFLLDVDLSAEFVYGK